MSTRRTTKRGRIGAVIGGQPPASPFGGGGRGQNQETKRIKAVQGEGKEPAIIVMGGRAFGGPGWNRGAMARGGRRSLSGAGADARCGKMDFRVPSTGRVPKSWAASHVRGDGGCRSVVVAGGSGGGMEKDGLQLHEGRRDWSWRRGASCSQEPSDPIPPKGSSSAGLRCLGLPDFSAFGGAGRSLFFFLFSRFLRPTAAKTRRSIKAKVDNATCKCKGVDEGCLSVEVSVFERQATQYCEPQKSRTWKPLKDGLEEVGSLCDERG